MKLLLAFAAAVTGLAALAYWQESRAEVEVSPAALQWASASAASPIQAVGLGEMVLVPAGEYEIGDSHQAEAPIRRVTLEPFLIDRHEVTNRQFADFVSDTGYVTAAEREGGAWVYRGGEADWKWVRGADWRHPLGAGSSIEQAMDHPVVLVTWHDATAYADWAGKRLPTEAEWEVAARAGLPAGESANAHSDPSRDGSANVWQGRWPQKNERIDGFFYTAPVGSFDANALGVYDMIGNVWEWTADWYQVGDRSPTLRVARGGSWFCSSSYCSAFRPGFRGKSPPERAFNNVGFRCARDVHQPTKSASARISSAENR